MPARASPRPARPCYGRRAPRERWPPPFSRGRSSMPWVGREPAPRMPPPSRRSRPGRPLPPAVDRVPGCPCVLAGHPYALLALLQETGLVHDEHPARLLREVLEHVFAQVVANLIGVPPGGVQQPLDPLRIVLAYGLSHLPAVLALDPPEQPEEVAAHSLPSLRAAEAMAYPPMKFSKRLRPLADSRRPGDPTLRDHDAPFLVPPEG